MSGVITDENGRPIFSDKLTYDLDGKPIANSAGQPFAFECGANRAIHIYGVHEVRDALRPAFVDAGNLLPNIPADVFSVSIPRATLTTDDSLKRWLYFVFDLAWAKIAGSPLRVSVDKSAWYENTSVALETVLLYRGTYEPSGPIKAILAKIPDPPSWYSVIDDVVQASVQVIDILLMMKSDSQTRAVGVSGGLEAEMKTPANIPSESSPEMKEHDFTELPIIASSLDEIAQQLECGIKAEQVGHYVAEQIFHVNNTPEVGPITLAYNKAVREKWPKELFNRLKRSIEILASLAAKKPVDAPAESLRLIAIYLREWVAREANNKVRAAAGGEGEASATKMEQGEANCSDNGRKARKVFVSYAHSSPEHKQTICSLVATLREKGLNVAVDADIKTPQGPEEGWPRWMKRQIKDANWVLIFFDELYRRRFDGDEVPDKGLGATWEGAIITHEIYRTSTKNQKFIPLLADGASTDVIPSELFGYTRYTIPKQMLELATALNGKTAIEKPAK